MIQHLLNSSSQHIISHTEQTQKDKFIFIQEKKLYDFLEQGLRQRKEFMSKLEEEKKFEEIEEEEKFSEESSSL
jgi:hypothetical protein